MGRREGTGRMENIDIITLRNLEYLLEVKIMDLEDELDELKMQLTSTRKVLIRKEQEMVVEQAIEEMSPKKRHNKRSWDNPEGL